MNMHYKKSLNNLLTLLIISSFALWGCERDTADSIAGPSHYDAIGSLNKENSGSKSGKTIQYPMSASKTFAFSEIFNYYLGGGFSMKNNNSSFSLLPGALTPPSEIPVGEPVTITMQIDRDEIKNELIFTFGPHGARFNPPAAIKLDWKDMNVSVPNLYYIDENGNYIPQSPDQIDFISKWMIIYVDHFSRYALSAD